MISVSVKFRAKSGESGTTSVVSSSSSSEVSYAAKAGSASTADYATTAGKASSATYAATAGALSEDALTDLTESLDEKYLSKTSDDTAAGEITFAAGLKVGDGTYGIDADGNATLKSVDADEVDGDTVDAGTLNVSGTATMRGNASVGGDLSVTGDTTLKGGLDVTGTSDLTTLNVSKDASVSGSLTVSGDTDLQDVTSKSITNEGTITTKNLTVTGTAHFFELVIDKVKSAGGAVMLTPADGFTVVGIAETDNGWKLYFLAEDSDGNAITNMWQAGDQALCMNFNEAAEGSTSEVSNTYWWRLVNSVSEEAEEVELTIGEEVELTIGEETATHKCHWIEVSSTDCDTDSAEPSVGNEVVMCGNRNDTSRQSAIYQSAYTSLDAGLTAPLLAHYVGIDDFKLSSHRQTYIHMDGANFVGNITMTDGTTIDEYLQQVSGYAIVCTANSVWVEDYEDLSPYVLGADGTAILFGDVLLGAGYDSAADIVITAIAQYTGETLTEGFVLVVNAITSEGSTEVLRSTSGVCTLKAEVIIAYSSATAFQCILYNSDGEQVYTTSISLVHSGTDGLGITSIVDYYIATSTSLAPDITAEDMLPNYLWDFEELVEDDDGDYFADSQGGANMVNTYGTITCVDGAAVFDGTQILKTPFTMWNGDLTIAFWITPTSISSSGTILQDRVTTGYGLSVFISTSYTGGISMHYGGVSQTFDAGLEAGAQSHIALVCDWNAGTLSCYKDGELVSSTTATLAKQSFASYLWMGGSAASSSGATNASSNPLYASVGELRIYDSALTAEEVALIYSGAEIQNTGDWSTTCPTLTSTLRYLWNYQVYTYTDGTTYTTDPHIIGVYGESGRDGTSAINGTCEGWWETWAEIYSVIADAVANGDTDATWLCNEIGETSSGTATASGAPYVIAIDSEGNYSTATADTGTCYVVTADNGDLYGHVFCAGSAGWEDIGTLQGADAEYYGIEDVTGTGGGSYVQAVLASAEYDSDSEKVVITENIVYAVSVRLAHVKGTTTEYISGATGTLTIGGNTFSLTESSLVYTASGTIENVSSIPQTAVVKLTYDGTDYTMTLAVTHEAGYLVQQTTDALLQYIQGDFSSSLITQTATKVTATVTDNLSSAGISITSSTVTIDASKVYILNGDDTAALFENGKISATYLDVDTLIADYIESNTAVLGSVFTEYLQSSSAVLGNVTIEGSIVYAQNVLNKGTEEEYLHTVDGATKAEIAEMDDTWNGNVISDSGNVASYALDVCTLDGTLVIERVVDNAYGFHLPFISVNDGFLLRGYTQYNSSAWRAMTFTDFRRLIGRELTIINNTGLQYLYLFIGYSYFVGNDTEPTELTDGIYILPAGGATLAIDYSSKYGYIWRASVASEGAGDQTPEQWVTAEVTGTNWDLPEECDSIDEWTAGEGYWQEDGTLGGESTSFLCPSAGIGVPSGTTTASIQTCATKTINGTTYHYTIYNIYAGTAGDSAASYLTDVTTLLADGDTALTGTGTLKACDDGTVYRADVNVEGYDYIVVSLRVFTETASGSTSTSGYDGLTAETAVLGTNVELSNLKILFY